MAISSSQRARVFAITTAAVLTTVGCSEAPVQAASAPAEDVISNAGDAVTNGGDAVQQRGVEDVGQAAPPTWNGGVGQLVLDQCGGCHSDTGIGPFRLDRPQDWKTFGEAAWHAIDSGRMPPFLADPSCGKFAEVRALNSDEKAQIKAWLEANQPLGDAAGSPPTLKATATLQKTDSAPMPEPYTPKPKLADDYRCFILDKVFAEDTYLSGAQVVPGTTKQVHHVLVYALSGKQLATAQAADAKQAGPGYACFGGPLPSKGGESVLNQFAEGFPTQLAAWVPGLQPAIHAHGGATRIRKGSRIVMQVHYNTAGAKPQPDTTRLDMILSTQKPKRLVVTAPLLIHDLDIQPNMTTAHERLFRYYGKEPLKIHSLTPHMHLLGTAFEATVVRKNGAEACGLRVPEWDFQWQQGYARPLGQPLVLEDGDGIRVRCVYNNKAENQPTVDGQQIQPKKVTWGDGSFDEMCMLYMDMSMPYSDPPPAGAKVCHGFEACKSTCASAGQTDCMMSCEAVAAPCHTCAIRKILSCAVAKCPLALLPAQACLTRCLLGAAIMGSNPGACLKAECGKAYENVRACLDPVLAGKQCAKHLGACGL